MQLLNAPLVEARKALGSENFKAVRREIEKEIKEKRGFGEQFLGCGGYGFTPSNTTVPALFLTVISLSVSCTAITSSVCLAIAIL